MTKFTQFWAASNHWAVYYDPTQDALVTDHVVAWALDERGTIGALVLDRDSGQLVPAQDYANYVAIANNSDIKTMTAKFLERGHAMRSWLLEEGQ